MFLLNDSNLEFVKNARYFCSANKLFSGHRKIGVSMSSKAKDPDHQSEEGNKEEKKSGQKLKSRGTSKKRFAFTAEEVVAIRLVVINWNSKPIKDRMSPDEIITSLKGKKGERGSIKKTVKNERIWQAITQFVNEVNKRGIKKGKRGVKFQNPKPSKKMVIETSTEALLKASGFSF